jgi:formylglycine-generating enzyme required for sulfatase activity
VSRSRNKWILVTYVLIWVSWLSLSPSRVPESVESPSIMSGVSNPQTPQEIPSSAQKDDEACRKCHGQSENIKVDYEGPGCGECHSISEAETAPPLDKAHAVANVIPAALSPSSKPSDLIYIPSGEFFMGSDNRAAAEGSGNADEGPLHKVYVQAFYIDQYEVTNEQYKSFADATGQRPPRHWKGDIYPPEKANHPVIYVSWFEANAYCHWVGKRLPTEAEWEKAARGTDAFRFPWGNSFDPLKANTPQRWLALNQEADTMPVGSFDDGKSPYGVYDMAGNVYEWTSSWYKPYANNAVPNVHYGEKNKIVRGGSWYDCLTYGCGLSSPTFNRSRFAPAIRNKSFGFRCAKS